MSTLANPLSPHPHALRKIPSSGHVTPVSPSLHQSPSMSARKVKFAPSPSIREIQSTSSKQDISRRSIPNIHAPAIKGKLTTAAGGFRRMSMFARNSNLTAELNKIEVTFIPPLLRFRRAARVIRLLCSVCIACKKSMIFSVAQNNWVALKEALLRESDVSKEQNKEKKKALNTDDPELSFDMSKFRRHTRGKDIMPVKIKELLRKKPDDRSADEVLNIVRTMQKLEIFARYPLSVQRRLCERGWLETVGANRVVLRSGHLASCVYYIISGRLVANGEEQGHMVTTLLKRGDKFGEEEIISLNRRSATVMSQDTVELFVVHGWDYKEICFSKGSKDISSLDICRKNPVFHHWPLKKLVENPSAWTMQNYKPGTLIVEDSGRTEWVYIIKSGQCKVVKCLKPGEPEEDPARIKKILARHARNKLLKEIETKNMGNVADYNASEDSESRVSVVPPSSTFFTTPLSRPQTHGNLDPETAAVVQEANRNRGNLTLSKNPFLISLYGPNVSKPVYVALEVLGAGDSFGFLAVLPKDQRGSSVSLISCGSEVIQINKNFFQRFADETVYSLINMKFPPFPKQHEILQNLRDSFMWKDYKQKTLDDALSHLYRPVIKQ